MDRTTDVASGKQWDDDLQQWVDPSPYPGYLGPPPRPVDPVAELNDEFGPPEPQPVYEPLESVNVRYDIPPIHQGNAPICWAVAMAMILSYRLQESIDPWALVRWLQERQPAPTWIDRIAARFNYERHGLLVNPDGSITSQQAILKILRGFGFRSILLPEASVPLTPRTWYDWLVAYGPLWVSIGVGTDLGLPAYGDIGAHAVVVRGLVGDVRSLPQSTGGPPAMLMVLNLPRPTDAWVQVEEFEKYFAGRPGAATYDRNRWRIWYLPPAAAESTG